MAKEGEAVLEGAARALVLGERRVGDGDGPWACHDACLHQGARARQLRAAGDDVHSENGYDIARTSKTIIHRVDLVT